MVADNGQPELATVEKVTWRIGCEMWTGENKS